MIPFVLVYLIWHLNRGDRLAPEQHRCTNKRRNYRPEFKREPAQLVVDQSYPAIILEFFEQNYKFKPLQSDTRD